MTSSRANSARRAPWAFVLAAMLAAALALAACGGGEGDTAGTAAGGRPPSADEIRLVVSRDFGAEVLRDVVVPAGDKTDALRVLAENAEVDTGYGGQFVSGIDGIASTFGGGDAAAAADWFYWVDGVMGDVGAADWKLEGGETVWWDFHRWADAMIVPAALHAFPRPYAGGALEVTAAAEVDGLADWAAANGLELAATRTLGRQKPGGGLVLATAADVAGAPWLMELLDPSRLGIEMLRVDAQHLRVVAPDGSDGPAAGGAALAVVNPDDPERPYLVVLGATAADLEAFVAQLTPESLNASVAVAQVDDAIVHLPWQGE